MVGKKLNHDIKVGNFDKVRFESQLQRSAFCLFIYFSQHKISEVNSNTFQTLK